MVNNLSLQFGFLEEFGYISGGGEGGAALHTEESVTRAIKRMQEFGSLEATGEITPETLLLLEKPRCGNSDVEEVRSKRSKRFVIGSKGWKKRHLTYK